MSVYSQVALHCFVCGSEFRIKKYRVKTARFCSKRCWTKRNPPSTSACEFCFKPFTAYFRKQRFCSRSCARSGTRSNAFKDGKSMLRDRARMSPRLKTWRDSVYKRDCYRCRKCGAKGALHAHHIKPWASHPELRFDVANGLTLCLPCHGAEHGRDFSRRSQRVAGSTPYLAFSEAPR